MPHKLKRYFCRGLTSWLAVQHASVRVFHEGAFGHESVGAGLVLITPS